jgi:hypothetical protein
MNTPPSPPFSPAPLIQTAQIPDWTWLQLSRGADWPDHPFHLVSLATVSADGRPSVRIMTNRGADRVSGRIWFYSHLDTPKVADLRVRRDACIVGYDREHGVQLRIAGEVILHRQGPVVDRHWQHVEEVSQWLFRLSPSQSAEAVGIDPRLPHDHDLLTRGLTVRSKAHFVVLEMVAVTIDWHQTDGSNQCRAVMHSADRWRPVPV